MKNENIHNGFTQKEIRDFLAQELRNSELEGLCSVEYAERQIEIFQKMLKYAKKNESVLYLIKEKGWEEWDISGEIKYDRETYFSFLGTEEEYNKLMKTLQKEK